MTARTPAWLAIIMLILLASLSAYSGGGTEAARSPSVVVAAELAEPVGAPGGMDKQDVAAAGEQFYSELAKGTSSFASVMDRVAKLPVAFDRQAVRSRASRPVSTRPVALPPPVLAPTPESTPLPEPIGVLQHLFGKGRR